MCCIHNHSGIKVSVVHIILLIIMGSMNLYLRRRREREREKRKEKQEVKLTMHHWVVLELMSLPSDGFKNFSQGSH